MSGPLARRGAVAGGILVGIVVAIALLAPWIAGDPNAIDMDHGVSAIGAPLAPSAAHMLGTDNLGRDVWARVAAGAHTSLWIAALATLASLVLGTAIGIAAGVAGPRVDGALMRTVDLVLAFPALLLAILLAALLRKTSLAESTAPVVISLVAVGWTAIARIVRARARDIARGDAITAVRALGGSTWRIATRHVLPGCAGLAITLAALAFTSNLLVEASLSYLGLGPPVSEPTWGRMFEEGHAYYRTAPWMIAAPGIALLLAVIGSNLIADSLRDRLEAR